MKNLHQILVLKYKIFNHDYILAIVYKSISEESEGYFSTSNIIYNFYEVSLTEKIFNDSNIINALLLDCQCALFLLDVTNKDSLINLKQLVKENSFNEFSYLNKILVENKIDEENKDISEHEINEFMENNNINERMHISVKNNIGIEDLSDKIKEYINNNKNEIPINFTSQNINEFKDTIVEKNDFKNAKTVNIIFLGNSNVGKSSLFLRIDKNHFKESFLSTTGIDRIIKTFKYKNEIFKVNLIDTAGQDRYRNNLPKSYYLNAHGVFLLFDVNDQDSFNDISIWMNEINQNCNAYDGNHKTPVIYLIGNKLDKFDRVVNREQAEDKASFYGIKYFEICCKLNINIQEVYSRMVLECLKNTENNADQNTFRVKDKPKQKKYKKNECCGI